MPKELKGKHTEFKLEELEGQEEEKDDGIYSLKLKLSKDDKKLLAQQICKEISKIKTDPDRIQKMEDFDTYEEAYNGVVGKKAPLFDGASDFHPYLGARHTDRTRPRLRQQLFLKPMWLIDPMEPADMPTLEANEKLLDWTAIVKMKIQVPYISVLQDSCKLGTGIMKITQLRKKEWFTNRVRFKQAETDDEILENLDEFLYLFGDKGRKKFPKIYNAIRAGEPVTFRSTYEDYAYNDPKAERVRPQDFIFSIGKKDLSECRLVGQLFKMYWSELKEKENTDNWDNVDTLRSMKTEGEEWKPNPDYETQPFECAEVIYKYQDKQKRVQKGVFVVALKNEEMLDTIAFPYFHSKVYFIPFYVHPDENSFWGIGLIEKVYQIERAEKRCLDILIDAGMISNIPSFFRSVQSGLAPQQRKFFPGIVYTTPTPTSDIVQLKLKGADMQLFNLISHFESIAEQRTHASSGMSGQESKLDPRAPAAKTIALLQEANIGISEYIDNIQIANSEVGYQIGQLLWQFMPEEKEYGILGETGRAIPATITRDQVVMYRANFRPHGSTAVANKAVQHALDLEVRDQLSKSPVLQSEAEKGNLEPFRQLDDVLLTNAGGNWDKRRDQILPSAEVLQQQRVEIEKEAIRQLMEERKGTGYRTGAVGAPDGQKMPFSANPTIVR